MLARTAALTLTLALTLPALGAQQLSISAQRTAGRAALGEIGGHGTRTVSLSSIGGSSGLWTDPAPSHAGSMSGRLVDATGALRLDVHAVLSEALGTGLNPHQRQGSLSGLLTSPACQPSGVASLPILMSGTWRLDARANRGVFQTTIYVQGPTPMAPVLLLGTMNGALRRPRAQNAPGARAFDGRWNMPTM